MRKNWKSIAGVRYLGKFVRIADTIYLWIPMQLRRSICNDGPLYIRDPVQQFLIREEEEVLDCTGINCNRGDRE